MLHFVYELVDDIDIPFYIGITNDPNARFSAHMSDTFTNVEKITKIQDLRNRGKMPRMRIIEIVNSEKEAEVREVYWIKSYKGRGIVLTNVTHYRPVTRKQTIYHLSPQEVHVAKKPHPNRKLKFSDLEKMWGTYLQKKGLEKMMLPDTLAALVEQFLAPIPPEKIRREKDVTFFRQWRIQEQENLRHPERYPFCNMI